VVVAVLAVVGGCGVVVIVVIVVYFRLKANEQLFVPMARFFLRLLSLI